MNPKESDLQQAANQRQTSLKETILETLRSRADSGQYLERVLLSSVAAQAQAQPQAQAQAQGQPIAFEWVDSRNGSVKGGSSADKPMVSIVSNPTTEKQLEIAFASQHPLGPHGTHTPIPFSESCGGSEQQIHQVDPSPFSRQSFQEMLGLDQLLNKGIEGGEAQSPLLIDMKAFAKTMGSVECENQLEDQQSESSPSVRQVRPQQNCFIHRSAREVNERKDPKHLSDLEQFILNTNTNKKIFYKAKQGDINQKQLDSSQAQERFLQALAESLQQLQEVQYKRQVYLDEHRIRKHRKKKDKKHKHPSQEQLEEEGKEEQVQRRVIQVPVNVPTAQMQVSDEKRYLSDKKMSLLSMPSTVLNEDGRSLMAINRAQTQTLLNQDLLSINKSPGKPKLGKNGCAKQRKKSACGIYEPLGTNRLSVESLDPAPRTTQRNFRISPRKMQQAPYPWESGSDQEWRGVPETQGAVDTEVLQPFKATENQTEKDLKLIRDFFCTDLGPDKAQAKQQDKQRHVVLTNIGGLKSEYSLRLTDEAASPEKYGEGLYKNEMGPALLPSRFSTKSRQSVGRRAITQSAQPIYESKQTHHALRLYSIKRQQRQAHQEMTPSAHRLTSKEVPLKVASTASRQPAKSAKQLMPCVTGSSFNTRNLVSPLTKPRVSPRTLHLTSKSLQISGAIKRGQLMKHSRNAQRKASAGIAQSVDHLLALEKESQNNTQRGPVIKHKHSISNPSYTEVVNKENPNDEQEGESERPKSQIETNAAITKSLFPLRSYDKKVEVIVPRKRTTHQMAMTTSPFLLALNQQKLTPFQTMRAFQKTRRLILEQGSQRSNLKLDTNFTSKIPSRDPKQTHHCTNPNILKLRSQKQLQSAKEKDSQTNQKQSLIHVQPKFDMGQGVRKLSTKTLRESWESIPMLSSEQSNYASTHALQAKFSHKTDTSDQVRLLASKESLQSKPLLAPKQTGQQTKPRRFRRFKRKGSVPDERTKQGYEFGGSDLVNLNLNQGRDKGFNQNTQTLKLLEKQKSTDDVVLLLAGGAEGTSHFRSDTQMALPSILKSSKQRREEGQPLGTEFEHLSGSVSEEELPLLRLQLKQKIESVHMIEKLSFIDEDPSTVRGAVTNKQTLVDAEGPHSAQLQGESEDGSDAYKAVRTQVEFADFPGLNSLASDDKQQMPSSQFVRKWTLEQTEKVIEVDEETSILNPSNLNRLSLGNTLKDLGALKSFSQRAAIQEVDDAEVPEETPKTQHAPLTKLVRLAKNTLTVPLKGNRYTSKRDPFSQNKKIPQQSAPLGDQSSKKRHSVKSALALLQNAHVRTPKKTLNKGSGEGHQLEKLGLVKHLAGDGSTFWLERNSPRNPRIQTGKQGASTKQLVPFSASHRSLPSSGKVIKATLEQDCNLKLNTSGSVSSEYVDQQELLSKKKVSQAATQVHFNEPIHIQPANPTGPQQPILTQRPLTEFSDTLAMFNTYASPVTPPINAPTQQVDLNLLSERLQKQLNLTKVSSAGKLDPPTLHGSQASLVPYVLSRVPSDNLISLHGSALKGQTRAMQSSDRKRSTRLKSDKHAAMQKSNSHRQNQ